jgi:hypothetical protein
MYICPYAYKLSDGLLSCRPREEIKEQIIMDTTSKYLNINYPLCPKNVKRNTSGIPICYKT